MHLNIYQYHSNPEELIGSDKVIFTKDRNSGNTDLPKELKRKLEKGTLDTSEQILIGNLSLKTQKNIAELPDNLTVNGHLNITQSRITKLPDGLTVNGDVMCGLIEKIGNNVTINGDLKIDYTSYRLQQNGFQSHFEIHERSIYPLSIGNNVTIKGKIDGDFLRNAGGQYIVDIGDNFTVGDIDMSMRLKEIPKNFKKGGDPIQWDKKDEYGRYKYL